MKGKMLNRTATMALLAFLITILWPVTDSYGKGRPDYDVSPFAGGLLKQEGVAEDTESLQAALTHKSATVRWIAAEEMGKRKVTAAIPQLKSLLQDKIAVVRSTAAEALLEMDDNSGVPALRADLDSPDTSTVIEAARILAAHGDDSGLGRIRPVLQSTNAVLRWKAIRAFASSRNGAEAYPALRQAVADDSDMVRTTAITLLREKATPEAVEILAGVLQSPHPVDRSMAATALNVTKRVEAIPYMIEALTNDDVEVRRSAVLGLTYLSGHSIGPRTKARVANLDDAHVVQAEWRQWWEANKATFKIGELGPPKFEDEPKK